MIDVSDTQCCHTIRLACFNAPTSGAFSAQETTHQRRHEQTVFGHCSLQCCRKALKGESRDVVDRAFSTARSTCMQEHCARRNLAQQSLEQFALLMKADINQLPHNMHHIVAALSYGKCEVLWYFQNVNEVCCPSWQPRCEHHEHVSISARGQILL